MDIFETIAKWSREYPELFALMIGPLLASLVMIGVESLFYPESWKIRRCQQVSFVAMVVLGTAASYGLWRFFDATDSREFTLWVSALVSAGSPVGHGLLSKAISWKWPGLDLSFGLKRNRSGE